MENDALLAFVESARLMLLESTSKPQSEKDDHNQLLSAVTGGPSWAWVCSRILDCLKAYSSGVTPAILLSDLLKAWLERSRVQRGWKCKENDGFDSPGLDVYKKQRQLRTQLSKIVTIDTVYEKKFISLDDVLEVVILDVQLLSGTSSYLLTLGDAWSSNSIDLYLHRKFYDLVDGQSGVLRKGREIRLTGCHLRTAVVAGKSQSRLLPTEYLVVLLDEEQDDDALLLGARFCSDTFSDIQLNSLEAGAEFCFYARLEKIGDVEVHAQWNHVKQQKLVLSDENKTCLSFILWDEQLPLAGLFSEGSMVGLERPFISVSDTGEPILEYGSASRLYTVPFIHQEEQITLESTTQKTFSIKDEGVLSQLKLPTDSQGLVDYSSFPFRLLVSDVRPKMSKFSLYGVVRSFCDDPEGLAWTNKCKIILQDQSGSLSIELFFCEVWRGEQFELGHTIFIAGVTSHSGPSNQLSCFWNEKNEISHLVNITQLPALLTSPCLYQVVPLSQLSRGFIGVQVCRVHIKNLELDQIRSKPLHNQCGNYAERNVSGGFTCRICMVSCDNDVTVSLSMVLTLYDTHNGVDGECIALCSGQPAFDVLQAPVQDFLSWSEDEQALYLYSLQKEEYMVTLYEGSQDSIKYHFSQNPDSTWCVGQALKCD